MKKYLTIVMVSLLFVSCEKNVIGDFDGQAAEAVISEQENIQLTEAQKLSKGAAYTNKTKRWSHKTSDLAAHWMYSWGRTLKEEIPKNVEYVPMFWGKSSVNDEELAKIKLLIDEGKVKYVLGFNEPDGESQANMTVDEAIALWPQLESLGVPLGSPAPVGFNNDWMLEFMAKADAIGLRIDFIAVHSYGGPNVLSFINNLKEVYNAYQRPIWITEFAVADWNATSPENNRHSEAVVMDFMRDALAALDDINYIHRYAWFDGVGRAPLASSALFDADAIITPLGQLYAGISPNNEIGPGQDTEFTPPVDDDELIVNGHFEGGTYPVVKSWGTINLPTGWSGYEANRADSEATDAYTGSFCGRILGKQSGALETVVNVEAGKTYVYKLYSKWAEDNGLVQKVVFKDHIANAKITNSDALASSTEWTETTGELTIPAGVTELRIVLWNDKAIHFYFDDISLKEKK